MTSELPTGAVALRPVLPLGEAAAAGSERFSQARVERILGVVVGFGCSVLGAQAFLNALTSVQEGPLWRVALVVSVFVPLIVMVVASSTGLAVRACSGVFAFVFPVVLLAWPAATAGRDSTESSEPWIWFLLNVGTVAAVMAFSLPLQIAWAVLIPVLYGVVRTIQVGPAQLSGTILDVVFAIILALVFLVLGWMLRSVAIQMDTARRDAVGSYAAAAAADASERERVAVAALMHDSVLAALIAAERARTARERSLAVSMAREALTRLANVDQDAGEGSDAPVPLAAFIGDLDRASTEAGGPRVTSTLPARGWSLPGRVARALVLATTQAISNSVEHAAASGLAVEVTATEEHVVILIADTGPGFDPDAVPDDRLGIRGSISARVSAVAGSSRIESGADGTRVTLYWERPS